MKLASLGQEISIGARCRAGMGWLSRARIISFGIALFLSLDRAYAEPPWLTLPPTPHLPHATHSGLAPVNGVRLWYAEFGSGKPVIFLHGGLANSNYWGYQVLEVAKYYHVIVIDSRGHGRSTRDTRPFSCDLMTSDVIGMMDLLGVEKTAVVGWSDGAIVGLNLAMHHPNRLTKLFAFAANSNPNGTQDVSQSPVFNEYLARTKKEYEILSPTPNLYDAFLAGITEMWTTQPNFTADQFRTITARTWIVDADHDEAIKRSDTELIAQSITDAGLLIQPDVSHFSFLQEPQQFTTDILRFMRIPEEK
jgi:pimeloyl-ACP methyl ester carboxylesterase